MKFLISNDTIEPTPASHPTRGAWIEIWCNDFVCDPLYVAPHPGCVD